MDEPLVIYHGGCKDGFCSAWVIHQRMPDADFFEGFYGQNPPDVTDRDIIMVDFSYKRPVLEKLAEKCKSLLILDHHKTAKEDLEGFERDNVQIIFDMERSGAGIAWDHFFLDKSQSERPWLVNYVEDRDLWRHALQDSRKINAYISTLEFSFSLWDAIKLSDEGRKVAAELGHMVMEKTRQYIREVAKNARRVDFEGYNIPLVNAPQVDISELLQFLAKDEFFSMGWFQRTDGIFQYGLRSKGDFDVSEIAIKHGGGGHKNAAGFQLKEMLKL